LDAGARSVVARREASTDMRQRLSPQFDDVNFIGRTDAGQSAGRLPSTSYFTDVPAHSSGLTASTQITNGSYSQFGDVRDPFSHRY
jgi:hypothetical protein